MRLVGTARLAVVTTALLCASSGIAQQPPPKIPKDQIPADISAELRALIQRLYERSNEQMSAIRALEAMGDKAAPAAPFLASMLDTGWKPVPSTAVKGLIGIGRASVEPVLMTLQIGDMRAKGRACIVLGALKDPRAIPHLVSSADDPVACGAVRNALAAIGRPALDFLVQHAADKSATTRRRVLACLPAFSDAVAAEAVAKGLGDRDEVARLAALEALGEMSRSLRGKPGAAAAAVQSQVLAALKDPDPRFRRLAVTLIAAGGADGQPLGALLGALGDPDATVQLEAVQALSGIRDDRAVDALIAAAKAEDAAVRAAAVRGLPRTGPERVKAALLAAVKDADPQVREQALAALAENPSPETETLLIAAMRDKAPQVRTRAVGLLVQMKHPELINLLSGMLTDQDEGVRIDAVRRLHQMGKPALDALIKAAGNDRPAVRREALDLLGRHPEPRTADILLAALGDKDSEARSTALGALTRFETVKLSNLQPVRDMAREGAPRRETAIEILGQQRDKASMPAFVAAVRGPHPPSAFAAVRALALMGADGIEPLFQAIDHSDGEVRSRIVDALAQMRDPEVKQRLSKVAPGKGPNIRPPAPESPEPRVGPAGGEDSLSVAVLVRVDQEAEESCREAQTAIGEKNFEKAVKLLQSLAGSEQGRGFWRMKDEPRRTTSVAWAANHLLGTMPAEAIDSYARLNDAPARALFEQARQAGNEGDLRRAARRYFHTEYGYQAMDLLGATAFDRGDFLAAARAWETLYREHRGGRADRPVLLAKAAVACHLAGAKAQAEAFQSELKSRHPDARAAIAAEQVRLTDFVSKALAAPPAAEGLRRAPAQEWASAAGAPDAAAVMPDCPPPWSYLFGPAAGQQAGNAAALLGYTGGGGPGKPSIGAAWPRIAPDRGRLAVTASPWGGRNVTFDLPAMLHPVVTAGQVLYRRQDEVAVCSLETGGELWKTAGLPLYRNLNPAALAENRWLPSVGDAGRYALTVGGGQVYTVCRFSWIDPNLFELGEQDGAAGSTLAAVPLAERGRKIAWEAGGGKGDDDVARQAKYLAAPTYCDGRLYVLATCAGAYHALCFDAGSGALIWRTLIGPVPTASGDERQWMAAFALEALGERGSPITVADGRAYLITNCGVVAALDAATGQPVWGHQYESTLTGAWWLSKPGTPIAQKAYTFLVASRPLEPVNPLIAVEGRLVCLPCDATSVFALDAQTGDLLWQTPREAQQDLSAVDDQRVLISGPDLVFLKVQDGSTVRKLPAEVLGKPAVTPRAVLAAERGAIVRVDLDTYHADRLATGAEHAILGRLISSQGRLVAANAAGVGIYAGPDKTRKPTGSKP
ncbi:MAG: HEAT repeat domain-containing protein [Thermoguttaceae bacterium]